MNWVTRVQRGWWLGICSAILGVSPLAAVETTPAGPSQTETKESFESKSLNWLTDYNAAMRTAREQRKMLFLYFHAGSTDAGQSQFERECLAHPHVAARLQEYVAAKIPVDAQIKIKGQPTVV